MSDYTKKDISQIEKIMASKSFKKYKPLPKDDFVEILNPETPEEEVMEISEEELRAFMMQQQSSSNVNYDELLTAIITQQLEEAYIKRATCGQSSIKLHGKSRPRRIFW